MALLAAENKSRETRTFSNRFIPYLDNYVGLFQKMKGCVEEIYFMRRC